MWGFRQVESDRWSFFTLILLLVGPATLYLAVSLLLPSTQAGEDLDLGERFDQIERPFFLCIGGVSLWLGTSEVVLLDHELLPLPRLGQLSILILTPLGAVFPTRRVANALGALILAAAIFSFSTFRAGLE